MSEVWSMKPEHVAHREQWYDALLSGRYKQALGALRVSDGRRGRFCCLGVACHISELGKWNGSGYEAVGGTGFGTLPDAVIRWIGVDDDIPAMCGASAVTLNDSRGFTFDEIALAYMFEECYQRTENYGEVFAC